MSRRERGVRQHERHGAAVRRGRQFGRRMIVAIVGLLLVALVLSWLAATAFR